MTTAPETARGQFKHLFTPLRIGSFAVRNRIHGKGGKMTLALQIGSVDGSRVVLSGVFGGPPEVREGVDTVVVSRGSRANDDLYKTLKGRVKELHAAGQCVAPRGMVESTLDGLRVGRMV